MQENNEHKSPENPEDRVPSPSSPGDSAGSDDHLDLDVSGKNLEFSLLEKSASSDRDFYLCKNEFNLLPRWAGELISGAATVAKTLKFSANEVSLFPAEFANLVWLERLQVKISPPGLDELILNKLKGLN